MLNEQIKEATKSAHQELEKEVILHIKAIRSEQDYADFLKYFYAYFHAVGQAVRPYITPEVLPDYGQRRNANDLKTDIETLGSDISALPAAIAPAIGSVAEALGAWYVLEGSVMGGPVIVRMLQQHGIGRGFGFFSGYGEETGARWGAFLRALNTSVTSDADRQLAIIKARETFTRFGDVFQEAKNIA